MTAETDKKNPSSDLTPDQLAAHDFLSELRTRVAVQPLPYQAGIEASALQSLWELFNFARKAMKDHPGCTEFARKVTGMLNITLRPTTAKWHRAMAEGRLDSRDGSDAFRADLDRVRKDLQAFAVDLQQMAYGTAQPDEETPPALPPEQMTAIMQPVTFGIVPDNLIPEPKEINASEAAEVVKRRDVYRIKTPTGKDAIGLGLSGGGIRSATFCLGALQVLAKKDFLKYIDFMSTVSGGGYTGSFLSSRLGNGQDHASVAGPRGPDPVPVRYLRQHAKYLSAQDLWQAWSMVTATLAGMVLNWTAPLFLIALAALLAALVPAWPNWARTMAWLATACAIALLAYGLLMRGRNRQPERSGLFLAGLTAATVAFGGVWVVMWGFVKLQERTLKTYVPDWDWSVVAIIGAVATAMPAILRFVPILQKPAVQQIVLKVALVLAGIVIPLAAIAMFYFFLNIGLRDSGLLAGLVALFFITSFLVLNINLTGPHRLYRDRLAETFVQHGEEDRTPKPLAELNPAGSAPYHLINTTVNLPSSKHQALRDRKSDFFLFSKHWSGAPAIGYQRTKKWRANGKPIDLATAMAISGAAFSANMGLASMPSLRALLTFLNVRLGFWIRRPGWSSWGWPGFACLMREMTGTFMSEKQKWLNLSDGGHIENMAVYELLRRRCKFVISIDGEADPASAFHGHLTLVRHAQIDLGIRIDSMLEDLRPHAVSKFSKTHYMFCRIHYPPAAPGGTWEVGLLLYVKLSATGNEEELIKRYRLNHPDFPHQTTLDQFFDEEQFEAYRELGAHVMDGLFSTAITSDARPETVPDWFKALAGNLLEPAQT
jgi:hypothetical protein